MIQIQGIGIWLPLAVGVVAAVGTMFIHALPLRAPVDFGRHEKTLRRTGIGFWSDVGIVARVVAYALLAHLVEMALWAVVFVICGEFPLFGTAFYHSAVNFTTLGYGDVIMTPAWRLLGPLEAANGVLMFGVSTAMIFAVIQRLVHARFTDLDDRPPIVTEAPRR
jgi:hypothetical protein